MKSRNTAEAIVVNNSLLTPMTGYLHPDYSKSLIEFGAPVELPRCGG